MHYRKIYERHYNCCLNKDVDIHHIDGNRDNNSIENLKAVSLDEHYKIHLEQGDFGAAQAIAMRIQNKDYISHCASLTQKQLLLEGKHNFQLPSKTRSELSLKTIEKQKELKQGIFKEVSQETRLQWASDAGKKSHRLKRGFHDPNKNGYNYVRHTTWWINTETKQRKRAIHSPGPNWKKGMK